MKYLAIAGLVAVAAANPGLNARDGWEGYGTTTKKVDPTTTWNEWEKPTTTTSAWSEWEDPEAETSTTWAEWDPKKPKPTDIDWVEWEKHPQYTTTVVTAITTYCPEPTTIIHAGKTWTVDKATTLTITDCPCTISVPVWTKTSTSCKEKPTPVKGDDKSTWVLWSSETPVAESSTWKVWESSKTPEAAATTWAAYPAPDATKTGPQIAKWTGAASKLNVGAGLAGIVGAAALLL